jgi:hypothetical protein
MKTCGNCHYLNLCQCGKEGWCKEYDGFLNITDSADDCGSYDGPEDTPEPHYQTEVERDNPRDPIIERS